MLACVCSPADTRLFSSPSEAGSDNNTGVGGISEARTRGRRLSTVPPLTSSKAVTRAPIATTHLPSRNRRPASVCGNNLMVHKNFPGGASVVSRTALGLALAARAAGVKKNSLEQGNNGLKKSSCDIQGTSGPSSASVVTLIPVLSRDLKLSITEKHGRKSARNGLTNHSILPTSCGEKSSSSPVSSSNNSKLQSSPVKCKTKEENKHILDINDNETEKYTLIISDLNEDRTLQKTSSLLTVRSSDSPCERFLNSKLDLSSSVAEEDKVPDKESSGSVSIVSTKNTSVLFCRSSVVGEQCSPPASNPPSPIWTSCFANRGRPSSPLSRTNSKKNSPIPVVQSSPAPSSSASKRTIEHCAVDVVETRDPTQELPSNQQVRVTKRVDFSCQDVSSSSGRNSAPSVPQRNNLDKLPDGVELTLGELQQMACRQQQQIDTQQQLLVAKEQRLRFLKQQEARHHQVAAENERLRRLRDRVEAQELKLRKLRALRGQVDQNKLNNASLTSDLDSIRALFNEKEKELSLAVAKVEELTRQLEELKRGRGANRDQTTQPSPAALELDKLRRELMYRNKLNEQQNARICQQREALSQRQEEMSNIDKRISELQDRLHRKRLLNQQLANQITAASNKANAQQQLRSAASATTGQQHPSYGGQGPTGKPKPRSGNIAAVEPYHHVPLPTNSDLDKQAQRPYGGQKPGSGTTNQPRNDGYQKQLTDHKHQILQQDRVSSTQDDFHTKLAGNQGNNHNSNATTKTKDKEDLYLPEFGGSKSDPKYQTLPYNTKFTVNFMSAGNKASSEKKADTIEDARRNNDNSETAKNNINNINNLNNNNNIINPNQQQQQQQQQQQHLMTVHSIPIPALSGVSKGLATGLSNQNQGDQQTGYQQHTGNNKMPPNTAASHMLGHLGPRPFGLSHPTYTNPALQPGLTRGQPVGGSSSTTSSTSSLATNSSSASSSSNHQVSLYACMPTLSTQHVSRLHPHRSLLPPTPLTLANMKPVSSVAPTSVQHQKPSPIYQTSSTKIHPVQPQTLSSTPQGILRDLRGELSPPQGTSTPLGTPETSQSDSRTKPALPPKPALPVKPTPPPRQTQHFASVDISPDAVDCALHVLRGGNTRGITQPEHLHSKQSHVPSMLDPDDLPPVPPCPPPPPPTSEPPQDDLPGSTNGSSSSMGQRRTPGNGATSTSTAGTSDPLPIIKARPLTIKKQPASEHPKLKTVNFNNGSSSSGNSTNGNVHVSINRRIEMPPAFLFPETEAPPADLISSSSSSEPGLPTSEEVSTDLTGEGDSDENNRLHKPEEMKTDVNAAVVDVLNSININQEQQQHSDDAGSQHIVRRTKKGNLKSSGGKAVGPGSRRVSFDPLALLLDASLEGELELVRKTAGQVTNPSAANDEGITALHNAICAGHLDIVKFLVEFGCDVNAQDSDGWTPLHCAASCNNLAMVRFLVEHGACIFATTLSDHETAAEKCEEDEEGFDGCSEYLYSVQEKLGILNNGIVYAVYDYEAHNSDELSFKEGDKLVVLRKGDEWEREWWWSRLNDQEGYVPRNLLGLYPRVQPGKKVE